MMNGVAQWTGDWGMMAAGATAGFMLLAFWSLPRCRGRLRRVADYLLP